MAEMKIDSDDLEVLLFAAGSLATHPRAAKEILADGGQPSRIARKLKTTITRVSKQWRRAVPNRVLGVEIQNPDYFPADTLSPPTDKELAALQYIDSKAAGRFGIPGTLGVLGLEERGFLESGVYIESIFITGNTTPETHQHSDRRFRLTTRGQHVIALARESSLRQKMAFERNEIARAYPVTRPPMFEDRELVRGHFFRGSESCIRCGMPRSPIDDDKNPSPCPARLSDSDIADALNQG